MMNSDIVTVVTGMARCGTSLMMRMLHAGGMPVVADSLASFEAADVIRLMHGDVAWFDRCRGRAVKIIDPHRANPPNGYTYRFIWMDRDPVEQAKSQAKFLTLLAGLTVTRDARKAMEASLRRDRPEALRLLNSYYYTKSRLLRVRFEDVLSSPEVAAQAVVRFIDHVALDEVAMRAQVKPRSAQCMPGLEFELAAVEADPALTGVAALQHGEA